MTKSALLDVDPLCLPVGLCVGPWRVLGWGGRGAYGTIYRVERIGRESEGSFALKLAIYPGDERFQREGYLLSLIHSPFVPRLQDQGIWEHPRGAFPYVVTEWVEGVSLYDWSARRNPTQRQMLEMLLQVARALEATHAAGGTHRDVKGDNVLVRVDARAFLTDFGAGHYRGAATLTTKLLPPSTPAYRSPEAWAFVKAFRRHPTAHYPASATDDLFALGVLAYRLVTDEYPPSTHPAEEGAEVWREEGPGPRPPRDLNPRVSPELDAIIQRLLAIAPIERFEGQSRNVIEAMARVVRARGSEEDLPMFDWGHEHRPRVRSPGGVSLAEERDAVARKEFERRRVEVQPPAAAAVERPRSKVLARARRVGVAALSVGVMLVSLVLAAIYQEPKVARSAVGKESPGDGHVAVGDGATGDSSAQLDPNLQEGRRSPVAAPLPEDPLPNQRKPPCKQSGEVELRGGCWFRIGDSRPPCAESAYAWNGACYLPSLLTGRQPTAAPP